MEYLQNLPVYPLLQHYVLHIIFSLMLIMFGMVGWFGWRWRETKRRLEALEKQNNNVVPQILMQSDAVYNDYRSENGNYHLYFEGKGEIVSQSPLTVDSPDVNNIRVLSEKEYQSLSILEPKSLYFITKDNPKND